MYIVYDVYFAYDYIRISVENIVLYTGIRIVHKSSLFV